jgi:hypothetical protein
MITMKSDTIEGQDVIRIFMEMEAKANELNPNLESFMQSYKDGNLIMNTFEQYSQVFNQPLISKSTNCIEP